MSETNEVWAVVELMGHLTLAGRLEKPAEFGGLWKIDVPDGEQFRTEFFGSASVYRIRITSEEIARAYATPQHEIIAYNEPIITKAQHENIVMRAQTEIENLRDQNKVLREQLTAIRALPDKTE